MKTYRFAIILSLVFCVIIVNSHYCIGITSYDNLYKFIEKRDDWFQIDGYEKNEFIVEEEVIYEVVDAFDDCIELGIHSYDFYKYIYNFTIYEAIWKAPIGLHFVNPNHFDNYYESWKNEENIFLVYAGWVIGDNFTDQGVRNAINRIFELEISGLMSDLIVNRIYDENTGEYKEIKDDVTFDSSVYVEYDVNGVLIKSESICEYVGEIYKGAWRYYIDRVEEFDTNRTSLNLLMPALVFLACYFLSKKHRREKN